MANEQLQKYLTAIKKNKETSAIVVIGGLLALVGMIYMQEASRVQVDIPMVQPGQLDEVLTPEITAAAELFEADPDLTTDGRYTHLVNFGLFMLRPQTEVQQMQQQADQRFQEAQTAFAQQQYRQAREICEEILTQVYPAHAPTQELLNDLMEILEPDATEEPPVDDPFGADPMGADPMGGAPMDDGLGTDPGFF